MQIEPIIKGHGVHCDSRFFMSRPLLYVGRKIKERSEHDQSRKLLEQQKSDHNRCPGIREQKKKFLVSVSERSRSPVPLSIIIMKGKWKPIKKNDHPSSSLSFLVILFFFYKLDYFGYHGLRASTGSHRRNSSTELLLGKRHRRCSSQPQQQKMQRYSCVLPPLPLSTTSSEDYNLPPLSTSPTESPLSPPSVTTPSFPLLPPIIKVDDNCSCSTKCAERVSVLLVDDNQINLQVLSRALRTHMSDMIHHIETARSGTRALELLKQQTFDLVLLDIDMPGLNGIDTALQIRNSKNYDILFQNHTIPIVAVTTNDSDDWKRSFAKAGMVRLLLYPLHIKSASNQSQNGFISKPVVPSVLKQTLYQVLRHGSSPESLAVSSS